MNHKCNKKECENNATQEVRLSLAVHASHEPALSTPLLFLCDEHATEATWQSLQINQNWKNICDGFERIGRIAPKKEFSKLIIQPITYAGNTSNSSLS